MGKRQCTEKSTQTECVCVCRHDTLVSVKSRRLLEIPQEVLECSLCTIADHHHISACDRENSATKCSKHLLSKSQPDNWPDDWPDGPEEQEAMLRGCASFKGEPENKEITELEELENSLGSVHS